MTKILAEEFQKRIDDTCIGNGGEYVIRRIEVYAEKAIDITARL